MAQNTFKTPPKTSAPRKPRRPRFFERFQAWVSEVIGFDRLFGSDNAWPIRNLDRILWVSGLILLYIGLNHNAERLIRNIQRTKTRMDEARAQYTTQLAEFMKSGKQSEISERVLADSLTDSKTPPYKIVVKTEDE